MAELYTPAHFAGDDAAAAELIDAHPLAQLVVATEEGLTATPVPMLRRGTALVGHLARGNPIWRTEGSALAIFTGADAYVSPRWYEAKAIDGKVVPTWNYSTVHAHGMLVAHDDPEWKRELVTQLTERLESTYDDPWAVSDAPPDYVDKLLRGIVGIELTGVRFECKLKLSQNRSEADQAAVTAAVGFGAAR
jgi:transcriptional regulator